MEVNWISTKTMPDYDGMFICFLVRKEDCGVWTKYQQVIECRFNKWVIKDGSRVTHWMPLMPEPQRTVVFGKVS